MKRGSYYRGPDELVFREEMCAYANDGCRLSLGGKPCYPDKLAQAVFHEDGEYMRDIIFDEEGRVSKIDFVRISRNKR